MSSVTTSSSAFVITWLAAWTRSQRAALRWSGWATSSV